MLAMMPIPILSYLFTVSFGSLSNTSMSYSCISHYSPQTIADVSNQVAQSSFEGFVRYSTRCFDDCLATSFF
ncbi:hypothetical protein BD408DRAFT_422747 [Parasitella parasitica]|nr:hypothetical protein BD408DRAFT_426702 [Parasitella parasitica]KAI8638650.1 hypothetical protein BD408DRAFT_422747 [Parasitella parasitica]